MRMFYLQAKVLADAISCPQPHGLLVFDVPLFMLWVLRGTGCQKKWATSFELRFQLGWHCCLWIDVAGRPMHRGGDLVFHNRLALIGATQGPTLIRTGLFDPLELSGLDVAGNGTIMVPTRIRRKQWLAEAADIAAAGRNEARTWLGRRKRGSPRLISF